MGKMIVARCSACGEEFRSRTRTASIRKIGNHWRKEHPDALSRRIKAGKRAAEQNPSIEEFVTALRESPRNAIRIYSKWTEYQYRTTKKYMDALKDVLPEGIVASWELIEVLHDMAIR
jgi:hypothetical protein